MHLQTCQIGEVSAPGDHRATAEQRNAASRQRRVLFVTDFYLEPVLLGIVSYARTAGWNLIANMRFHGRFPTEDEADGILATVVGGRVRNWLQDWQATPTVRMIATKEVTPYPAVELDYRAAGQAGAAHLLELGNVHFAFYWMFDSPDICEARDAFFEEIGSAGRQVHAISGPSRWPQQDVLRVPRSERMQWLGDELSRLPKPLAIMSDDDRRSLELLAVCRECGLRVPEDVAILGCDNAAVEQRMAEVPLSSVDMNFERLGWESAAMLDRLMEGECLPTQVKKIAPRGVLARTSTAAFSANAPNITAALLHLRENFHRPLKIEELARVAGLSKRLFQNRFHECVGRSARDEIHRARLARVTRLLRDTDLKLDAIAVESGFGSGKYLSAAFTEHFGVSPNAWRQTARQS